MSVVLISHHDETIYDINKTTKGDVALQDSRFTRPSTTNLKKSVLQELEKQKRKRKAFGIMGRPKQPLPDPKSFLKKHTGKVFAVDPKDREIGKVNFPKKEAVPKTVCAVYEQMHKLHHNKKNFVHENVKKALEMKPKVPIRKEITDVKSHGFKIVPKEPEQVSNKIFAKIPRYLDAMIKQRQAEIEAENELKGIVKQKCTYITRDERKILLEVSILLKNLNNEAIILFEQGLKKNWDELQRVYQGLPILTDTIPKKTRKRELENQLLQLEKDIVLIERHPFIYVYNDDEEIQKDSNNF